MIVVSHDRYFLDRVVNRIFSFEGDGLLHQSEGGYEEYLAHKEAMNGEDGPGSDVIPGTPETARMGGAAKSRGTVNPAGPAGASGSSGITDASGRKSGNRAPAPRRKLTFTEQREYATLEGIIDELTEKSEKLAEEMLQVSTDYVKLQELAEEKQRTDAELDEKIERFLELQELVESFERK